jgi:hypothetical protein
LAGADFSALAFLFSFVRSIAMSAIGNFIKDKIVKPLEKAVSSAVGALGKGMECLGKLAKGDLKGAATSFMEGCKSAMQAVSAATDMVPGLKMTPMGLLKDKAMGLAEKGMDAGIDIATTGGKNLGQIAKSAVMDALPKPTDIPGVQMAMDASKAAQG